MENIRKDPARVFLAISTLNALCLGFTFGTYVLFLKDLGLNPVEINIANCAFFLGRFFLEVPTGAIADTYGRRASSLISFGVYAAGLLIYWQATGLWSCIAAELVLAVGATCLSGAFDAWVVDEMRALGRSAADVHRVFVREALYDRLATIVGAPIGGFVAYAYGMATPWLIASVGLWLLLMLAMALMRETRVVVRSGERPHKELAATAQRSIGYAVSPGPVRAFLLVSACFTLASMAPNMQWAPYFEEAVGGSSGTGLLFSGIAILVLIGSWLSPYMRRRIGDDWAGLGASLFLAGIGLVAVPALEFPFSLAPFALYEIANGMFTPLKKASLNNAIDSDDRATVLSCEEMTTKLGGFFGLLVTGLLAKHVSLGSAWICGGAACLVGVLVIYQMRMRRVPLAEDPL